MAFNLKFKQLCRFWLVCCGLSASIAISFVANADDTNSAENKTVRVIATAPHIVEMLYAIEAGDNIVGTTEHSDYPQAAQKIPRIGNYAGLQIEKILALKPDYIVAWKTGNPPQDLARLEKLGIPIIYSEPNGLESVAQELKMLGKITHKTAQAEQAAQAYLDKLAVLRKKYQNTQTLTVFYQLWAAPLTTIANQAWPQHLLNVCNVTNPFVDLQGDYPQISIEHVLVQQPQVIIIPSSLAEPNEMKGFWQKYPQIPAVKNEQIKLVNSDKLHRMTPRSLDELEVMCDKLNQARAFYY
ncbi:cobalamin-binding protein [Catenovulum sp. 2E275]|uniref:cobalamin-binding protein n=1 Tax=Catenovulum sp. 2E275 TaxID=2980497 RepID=UPI0021CE7A9C|nr:cobalamin-binding protein [Catenovulum sp. 2E275]MCU4674653.1 cobalamin-binding protein [Catenovulum sp. 2E275]